MNIRLAKPEDAATLAGFNRAMALETESKTLDPDIALRGVEAVFQDEKKGFYVVAADAGRIVGWLMITFEWSDWRASWFWWIQSVYILPQARGQKIYSRLYDFVRAEATPEKNVRGIRLYVETNNTHAQRVYEKLGMHKMPYLMYEENL